MSVTLAQLRDKARVLADLVGSTVLLDPEFDELVRDGIRALWADVTSVNKDFRVNVQAFTLTSTNSLSFPSDFREVRMVRRNPGTEQQEILQKLGARMGSQQSDRSYRLQDRTLYIEPLVNAAGTYDMLYTPTPPLLLSPDFTARLGSAALLMAGDYVAAGTGVGKTLTSLTPGAPLVVDGEFPGLGDIVFYKDASPLQDNGLYSLTQLSAGGIPWVLTRLTTFDQNSEIRLGQNVYIADGAVNRNLTYTLTSFPASIDTAPMQWTAAATQSLDAEIEQHQDYIVLHATIEAMGKTESDSSTFFRLLHGVPGTNEIGARGRLMRWASDQRAADPDVIEDVRRRRRWMT